VLHGVAPGTKDKKEPLPRGSRSLGRRRLAAGGEQWCVLARALGGSKGRGLWSCWRLANQERGATAWLCPLHPPHGLPVRCA